MWRYQNDTWMKHMPEQLDTIKMIQAAGKMGLVYTNFIVSSFATSKTICKRDLIFQ